MKRLRLSSLWTRTKSALSQSSARLMVDSTPKSPTKESEGNQQSENTSVIEKYVDIPLRDLTDQVHSLVRQVQSSAEIEQRAETAPRSPTFFAEKEPHSRYSSLHFYDHLVQTDASCLHASSNNHGYPSRYYERAAGATNSC
jgi:hypothetical protein